MNNNLSTNEFGESDQIYAYTIWVTSIQQFLSIFGIAFNSALVYITIKHKSLHRSYGFLLAICSLCDALLESATPLATILVFLRRRISLLTCFYTQFIAGIGAINSYLNLFFISLDRLGSLAFPLTYRYLTKNSCGKFVLICNVISLSIVFYNIYLAYTVVLQHPEIMVYCEPGDIFQGEALTISGFFMMAFTMATIVIYIIIWIMLKVLKSNGSSNSASQVEITRRIFKSLAVIMTVIFLFWFMCGLIITMLVPRLFGTDPPLQFLITRIIAQLITVAGAINAPVLYFCSSEYREIMKREFRWIKLPCSAFQQPINNSKNVAVVATKTIRLHKTNACLIKE
uniref:G-protein coupled receptors family 1 profile domain-containing protein n=1 Tax=Globodera rostochiensis TaxID=31243 RepID=A0A914HG73_GLORO